MNWLIWFAIGLILLGSVSASLILREYEFNNMLLVYTEKNNGKILFGYDEVKKEFLNSKETSKLLRSFENITRT